MEKIFPKTLKKGDKIAIISPAGAVEASQLQPTLDLITEKGFIPVSGKNLYTRYSHGYTYAGTEKQRCDDLNWALNDPKISAVWASRGGYGCQHLLPNINLEGFKKNPKWYIGYSDNTVIQSFLYQNGFASIHGQTIKTSSFGVTDESYSLIFDILKGKKPDFKWKNHDLNKKGTFEGEIIGGNLALIYALLGTPYNFDFKDKILFIEDIGEKFYALDRMLMSLDLAGVFKQIKGLVVGGMIGMEDKESNKNYDDSFDAFAYKIIAERVSAYNFPVAFGFPNGHIRDNRPLIIGAKAKLKVDEKSSLKFN